MTIAVALLNDMLDSKLDPKHHMFSEFHYRSMSGELKTSMKFHVVRELLVSTLYHQKPFLNRLQNKILDNKIPLTH